MSWMFIPFGLVSRVVSHDYLDISLQVPDSREEQKRDKTGDSSEGYPVTVDGAEHQSQERERGAH